MLINIHPLPCDLHIRRTVLLRRLWLSLLVVLLSGCVTGLGGRPELNADNQATEARIKVALARQPELNAAPLNIQVKDGVATIDGFVESAAQRERIRAVASGVAGVTAVNLDIEVK